MIEPLQTKSETLAEDLLAGADLAIFLRPDETIKARAGTETYIESLKLPHILIQGNKVWAFQEHHCVQHTRGKSFDGFSYYAYTNAADIFANLIYTHRQEAMQTKKIKVQIMSSGRYAEMKWNTRLLPHLVWDSKTSTTTQPVIDAIKDGQRFKIALLDQNNIWHIHPVHYPFHYPNGDKLQFQTHAQFYPAMMQSPVGPLVDALKSNFTGILSPHDPEGREKSARFEDNAESTYFSVFNDGTYYSFFDIFEQQNRPYKQLKVFAAD